MDRLDTSQTGTQAAVMGLPWDDFARRLMGVVAISSFAAMVAYYSWLIHGLGLPADVAPRSVDKDQNIISLAEWKARVSA